MARIVSDTQHYTKLEHRLVLLAWLNSLLGYETNKDMLANTKGADEGFSMPPAAVSRTTT